MKNRFDRAAKDTLAEALALMADVLTGVETSPDAQSIDVWSVPTAEPLADLGWLGQMAREPCLIEPYSGTVKLDEGRDCLRKQLGRHHELQNKDCQALEERADPLDSLDGATGGGARAGLRARERLAAGVLPDARPVEGVPGGAQRAAARTRYTDPARDRHWSGTHGGDRGRSPGAR